MKSPARGWEGHYVAAAIVGLMAATPVAAQRLGGGTAVAIPVGRIIAALLLCALLALAAAVAIKRRGGRIDLGGWSKLLAKATPPRRIEIVETHRASQYADICLIRCDAREYLVLCSSTVQTVLAVDGAPAASSQKPMDVDPS
jgi:hypothetical protein